MSNLNTLVNEVAAIKNDILTCHENLKNKLIDMEIDVDNKKLGELIESIDVDSSSKIPKWLHGTWHQRNGVLTSRHSHASVVIDQDIYTMGGYYNSTTIGYVCKNNVADNTAKSLTDMPKDLMGHAAAAVGRYIYVMGGSPGVSTVQTNYCYDVDNNSWTEKISVPYIIKEATAVAAGSNIYLMGGISTDVVNLNYRYDVVLDEWFPMESMPYGVSEHAAVIKGKYIYVLGGRNADNVTVDYNLRYDITTNQWEELEPIPVVLYKHSAAVCGNYIYVYGGVEENSHTYNTALYRYSITSDEWTDITNKTGYPGNLEGHTAVIIDNGMYIICGLKNGATNPNIYCYICE